MPDTAPAPDAPAAPALIKTGIILQIINRDEVKLEGEQYRRYSAFLYPNTTESRDHLLTGILLAIKHKNEQDEYMKSTFQLNNELVKKGLK